MNFRHIVRQADGKDEDQVKVSDQGLCDKDNQPTNCTTHGNPNLTIL